jgi:excisionase family DNA binding protein
LKIKEKIMAPRLAKKIATGPREGLERQTYTVEEAAKILGVCRSLAYRKGVLPTVRIAGRRLVPKQALERMLAGAA